MVMVVLGVLAVVVTFSVRGVLNDSADEACGADARTLTTAADVYMAEHNVDMLPGMGTSNDRHELLLVNEGLIKQVSTKFDLAADGTVTSTGQPCT